MGAYRFDGLDVIAWLIRHSSTSDLTRLYKEAKADYEALPTDGPIFRKEEMLEVLMQSISDHINDW